MSDTVLHLQNRAKNIKSTPAYQPYSKVRIIVGNDEDGNQLVYEAGNDSARTLEITNPYGTQALANSILQRLSGYQYAPYTADGALLNPAAELGDGITFANGVYSFISSAETTLSPIMSSTVAAYEDGELNHEYPYETRENKEIARKINGIRTDFIVELGRVESTIEDMDAGYSSRFTQLSNSITAEVTARQNADSQMSSRITQNANSITSEVNARTSADNSLSSRITQNANSITSEVNARTSADNNLSSRITQNANSITSEVTRATTAEGNLNSRITQTANSITAQVNGIYAPEWDSRTVYQKGYIVKHTNGTTVTYYQATRQNTGVQPPNSTYWTVVSSPNVQSIMNLGLDSIQLGYQESTLENSATITLNRNGVQIDAKTITMTNVVADSISASDITSGTLNAEVIGVDGSLLVYAKQDSSNIYCGELGGGWAYQPDHAGSTQLACPSIALISEDNASYVAVSKGELVYPSGTSRSGYRGFAVLHTRTASVYTTSAVFANTNAGGTFVDYNPYAVIESNNGTYYLSFGANGGLTTGISNVSDRRTKTDIDYDISQYEKLFMQLKPCSYKKRDDNCGKIHTGYIAQDVEEALENSGIKDSSLVSRFAEEARGFSRENPMLALEYDEINAIQTHMIQQLVKRVDALESKLNLRGTP